MCEWKHVDDIGLAKRKFSEIYTRFLLRLKQDIERKKIKQSRKITNDLLHLFYQTNY